MVLKIGNRVTEKDIRDWLDKNQYFGGTAVITDLELYAIKRPGWVQVFSFQVEARFVLQNEMSHSNDEPQDIKHQRWGVVLDDERVRNLQKRTQIWLFENEIDWQGQLDELSQEMIVRNSNANSTVLTWISVTVVAFLIIASLISLFFP